MIDFSNNRLSEVTQIVYRALGLEPTALKTMRDSFAEINREFVKASGAGEVEIPDRLLPLVKMALIRMRREKAANIEQRAAKTFNHELRQKLDAELVIFEQWLKEPWTLVTQEATFPPLTDFVLPSIAEKQLGIEVTTAERPYDEKFHILWAPELFISDLNTVRASCELRGKPLSVAYIDIDNFKKFNTKYTEPVVDRDVLPKFMTVLEGHLFARGFAYRNGGDEYVALLPNATMQQACVSFAFFQRTLAATRYFNVNEPLTVSVGICEVPPNSPLTDREVERKAAIAKKFAKDNGKDKIAQIKPSVVGDDEVSIFEMPKAQS